MTEAELADLLREHAVRHTVPGAGLGILHDGVMTSAYHGVANVMTGARVTADTRFSSGSLTKPMVATVIARLGNAGKLSLDDPVAGYLDLPDAAPWTRRATVRDLMANQSGLPLRADLEFGFAQHADEDDGALSRLAAMVGRASPTAGHWSYSNAGWCLLGRMVETITGLTWEAAMRRLLFEPAGMAATMFATGSDPVPRASGHAIAAGRAMPMPPQISRAYGPAGASVITTVADLLRFAALHLEDASLAPLRVAHAEVAIYGWLDAWGLGWARFDWDGREVWGWDGLIDGERSVVRILPAHRSAVVLVANSVSGRAMYRSLFAELLKRRFGIAMPALRVDGDPTAAADLSRFAGRYAWPDREVRIHETTTGIVLEEAGRAVAGVPLNERNFVVDRLDPDNPTITFGAFDATGRPGVVYDMLWGLPRVAD